MPTVKLEQFLVVEEVLNLEHGVHFPNGLEYRINAIDEVEIHVECLSTIMLNEEVRKYEHDSIVD